MSRLACLPLLALTACIARLPEEPPARILQVTRSVALHLASTPEGMVVFEASDRGIGRRLGTTPLVIAELSLEKEIWKHGNEEPEPFEGALVLERREQTADPDQETDRRHAGRGSRRWRVFVQEHSQEAPRLVELEIKGEHLARVFAAGRADFVLPRSPEGPVRLLPEPADE